MSNEPDDPRHSDDDPGIPDLWSGTEMAHMLGIMAHLTKLCANASKAILDGDPEALAGSLGTIIGRAKGLREHVWEYTKLEPGDERWGKGSL